MARTAKLGYHLSRKGKQHSYLFLAVFHGDDIGLHHRSNASDNLSVGESVKKPLVRYSCEVCNILTRCSFLRSSICHPTTDKALTTQGAGMNNTELEQSP